MDPGTNIRWTLLQPTSRRQARQVSSLSLLARTTTELVIMQLSTPTPDSAQSQQLPSRFFDPMPILTKSLTLCLQGRDQSFSLLETPRTNLVRSGLATPLFTKLFTSIISLVSQASNTHRFSVAATASGGWAGSRGWLLDAFPSAFWR